MHIKNRKWVRKVDLQRRKRILVVDDMQIFLEAITSVLKNAFEIESAICAEDADSILSGSESEIDCVLIDVNLRGMSGIKLARNYRKMYPSLGIILITANPRSYYSQVIGTIADDCLDKFVDAETLIRAILNVIWKKGISPEYKKRQEYILNKVLHYKKEIRFVKRSGAEGAEKIEGITNLDNCSLAWVVYNVHGKQARRNIICFASTLGCAGRCIFCLSGKRRPLIRNLSEGEIIAQFIHATDSFHIRGWEMENKEIDLNFSCEGDSVFSNIDNCCEAIQKLHELGLDMNYIMTTIGHEANLNKWLKNYSHLPITFYWSLNFLDQELRRRFMPATKDQSLLKLRNIFNEIAVKTNRIVTASWILMKGINDSHKAVEQLKGFFADRPFEIKVMALEGEFLAKIHTSSEEVDRFIEMLKKAGLPCRKREIVGGKVRAGCGTTIPDL